jgi:hypothetical protein
LIADAALSSIKQVSLELSDAGHKPAHTLLRVPRHREEETYPDDPGSEERRIRASVRKIWNRSCIPAVGRLDRSVPGYVRSNNWSLKVVSGFAVSSSGMLQRDKLSLSSAEVKRDGGHR